MSNVSKASSKFGEAVGLSGAPVFIKSDNIIDLILADHNNAKALYENYKISQDPETKRKTANNLIRELVLHDECEQLLVYPMLREKVGGEKGEQEYERSLKEHQEHRELLYAVKNTDFKKDPQEFDDKLKKAIDSVFDHVAKEEKEVLPLLKEHLTEDQLKKIGASFKAHKPLTATRPHPGAPSQGYPAAAASVMLKPFDAAKDFLEG
jgi:hemerythrin superfamily protein